MNQELEEFIMAMCVRRMHNTGYTNASMDTLRTNYIHRSYLKGFLNELKGLTEEGDLVIDDMIQSLK